MYHFFSTQISLYTHDNHMVYGATAAASGSVGGDKPLPRCLSNISHSLKFSRNRDAGELEPPPYFSAVYGGNDVSKSSMMSKPPGFSTSFMTMPAVTRW